MRRAHYLKGNRSTELPSTMIFVDTETRGEQIEPALERHKLWFGVAAYVRIRSDTRSHANTTEQITFDKSELFWDWAISKCRPKSKLYIFAHNWNFDGSILDTAAELHNRGFETLQYINGKPPFFLRVKRDNLFLCLVDSMNYFSMSLAQLGASIGIPKLELPNADDSRDTWETYCVRDVQVLQSAILQYREFIRALDLGNFRPTLASQAFNAYRHRFMSKRILIHDVEDVLTLERESYYGGRVDCFHIGKLLGEFWYLDVNSLYPSVMASNPYPTTYLRSLVNPSLEIIQSELVDHAVTAEVRIQTTDPVYPLRKDDRLIFPIGEFTTTLSTPELSYALEHGHIKCVYKAAIYKQDYLFKEYVTELYTARQQFAAEGNTAFAFMCKIMLNSLYGKFGQRGVTWLDVRQANDSDPIEWLEQQYEGGTVRKYRRRAGIIQAQNRDDESRDSFPAIAAHVTAYGRMKMWKLLQQATPASVFYMDTDSLFVDGRGFENLRGQCEDGLLGALKIEQTANTITLRGPKDYEFGNELKHKGIRKEALQISQNVYEQLQFASWDWHLGHGQEGFIDIRTVRKHLAREYKKGVVQTDGHVKPFVLG